MLAVTGANPAFVCDIKPSRFVNEALDALAICQPAKSPPLDSALRDLAEAGGLLHGQGVLITTRPEYCHLTVAELCTDLVPDAFDIGGRLTIVPATTTGLATVVQSDNSDSSLRRPSAAPLARAK